MTSPAVAGKLSVVILTRDEEPNIADCLESVRWADEIIVIDDNSSDRTVEIAKRYAGKVITRALNGDFSAQRNAGIEEAAGDWILQMDADERVTEGLKEKITEVLKNGSPMAAFRFRRVNIFCGKPLVAGGEDLHKPLRLFKKDKAKFSRAKIHEELVPDGPTGELDAAMEHRNFPDISHYVSTQDFYSALEAKALSDKVGLLPEKMLRGELLFGPVKLFFKIYLKRKGYKDGMRGLIFAVLSAWRRFLIYAKYWELNRKAYD